MVTKIFPTAYVDGIRDVSHVAYGTSVTPARCSCAGASPSWASRKKTASRSRNLVVSRGTNGSTSSAESGANSCPPPSRSMTR